jgi:hypothetical protein
LLPQIKLENVAIEACQKGGTVQLGPALGGKTHVGQYVGFSVAHQLREFWHPGTGLISDFPPLLAGDGGIVLGERSTDSGGDDAALRLACIRQGAAHEMHAGAVEKAASIVS